MTARARNSREDVVQAAGRLFAERGFHGTSMRDLGRELGLLGSSLYSHIGGKEELLVEVIRRGAAMFQGLADRVLASRATATEKLGELVRGHARIIAEHLDEARTFLNEGRFLPEPARDEVVAMRDRYQGAYRKVLEEGRTTGEFRPGLDPRLGAVFVLAVVNSMERWYRPSGALTAEQTADQILEMVLEGLR